VIAFTAWSSFAHAALMGAQACRNMVARGELIGVGGPHLADSLTSHYLALAGGTMPFIRRYSTI
jgi:hypothetical protein